MTKLYKYNEKKFLVWTIEKKKISPKKIQVTMKYGQEKGKMTVESYFVTKGKNIGRANATTPDTQADFEIKARIKKQMKLGYSKEKTKKWTGKVSFKPMLAKVFQKEISKEKHRNVVNFLAQPKLDGVRCLAFLKKGEVVLQTRKGEEITSCPHINYTMKIIFDWIKESDVRTRGNDRLEVKAEEIFFDGELYIHKKGDEDAFRELCGAIRKKTPTSFSKDIVFHIFDVGGKVLSTQNAVERKDFIENHVCDFFSKVNIVPTKVVDVKDVKKFHTYCFDNGYEGAMFRKPHGLYSGKRTDDLLKYKVFLDGEFKIIGMEKGKSKTVMARCVMPKTKEEFLVTMTGNKNKNQNLLKKPSLWKGKKLTVKYISLTKKGGVPKHATGERIHD